MKTIQTTEKAQAWVKRHMTFERFPAGWRGEDNDTGEVTAFYPKLHSAVQEAISNRLDVMAQL